MEMNEDNSAWAEMMVHQLSCLKGYAMYDEGWAAMTRQFLRMVPSREAGEWLIERLLETEDERPSPARMREVLDRKYKVEA